MAKDGSVQIPKRPEQPTTQAEDFWQSEEGQWIDQQYQRYENGEITLDQAMQEYDKKFGAPNLSGAAKTRPQIVTPVQRR